MNNLKIVYKKPTEYDNDSVSSTNSKINLDDSIYSTDNDINLKENINNENLRENILKEIKNNGIPNADYGNNYNNGHDSNDSNNSNNSNDSNDGNDSNYNDLNYRDNDNNYYYLFLNYLKTNNINISELSDNKFFNSLIKKFILENKLDENEIIIFLKYVRDKLDSYSSPNSNSNSNSNNFNTTNNAMNKFENFSNSDEQQNNDLEISDETYNASESTDMKIIFGQLLNNDINTWIFVSVILISFIVIIMMLIYKK